jgi:hypothetical protein
MVSLKVFNSVGEELRRIEQPYDGHVLGGYSDYQQVSEG